MRVSEFIKTTLDSEDVNNGGTKFLREYYNLLLRKADEHKKIVQTNKDIGFIGIHKTIIKG